MGKNLMLGLIALFSATGCVEQEILESARSQEMTFNAFVNKPVAGIQSDASLKKTCANFGIWGYCAESVDNSQTDTDSPVTRVFAGQEMNNRSQGIFLDASTASWQYDPVKSWMQNKSYRFYAYAPFQISIDGNDYQIRAEHDNMGVLEFPDFTICGEICDGRIAYSEKEKQVDLLVSECSERQTRSFNNQPIALNFGHVLTNVNVQFRSTCKQPVEILYTELKHVFIQADGKVAVSDNKRSASWSAHRTPCSFLGDYPLSPLYPANTQIPGQSTSVIAMENMYMIPQGFDQTPLTLLVRYKRFDSDASLESTVIEKEVLLSEEENAWRPGARITYNVIIRDLPSEEDQEISFGNVTVGDWEEA